MPSSCRYQGFCSGKVGVGVAGFSALPAPPIWPPWFGGLVVGRGSWPPWVPFGRSVGGCPVVVPVARSRDVVPEAPLAGPPESAPPAWPPGCEDAPAALDGPLLEPPT